VNLLDIIERFVTRHGWASEEERNEALATVEAARDHGSLTAEPSAPAPVDVPHDPSATAEGLPA